jgi:16S rRNA (adenine1518-N6/adenine1519-N6)-dimethyltransferase
MEVSARFIRIGRQRCSFSRRKYVLVEQVPGPLSLSDGREIGCNYSRMPQLKPSDFDFRSVRRILNQLGVHPSKRRGQSFLVNQDAAAKIVARASLATDDTVLEIGPGLGSLTNKLVQKAGRVLVVESDRRLVAWLRARFEGYANLEIVHGDALTIDLRRLLDERTLQPGRMKVVSNIPYSISTSLIAKLFVEVSGASLFVLTVQRELATRITAAPGGKDYGAFTVFCAYHAEMERAFTIPPSFFYPRPEVLSSVVVMRRCKIPPVSVRDEKGFFAFVRMLFSQRRKMVKTTLKRAVSGIISSAELIGVLTDLRVDPTTRPERLSLEQFAALYDGLHEKGVHLK